VTWGAGTSALDHDPGRNADAQGSSILVVAGKGPVRRRPPQRLGANEWDRRLETIKRLAEAAHRNAKDPDERQ
jgi:hypothetical protein